MERTIGNLKEEMKQPSQPYANLSQRGVRRAQVNALKAMIPELDPVDPPPCASLDISDGYMLLRARDRRPKKLAGAAAAAIQTYLERQNNIERPDWSPRVH
jgi:hypothetical protein